MDFRKTLYTIIPDPYYSGADGFELVLDLLEDSCDGLLNKMKKGGVTNSPYLFVLLQRS